MRLGGRRRAGPLLRLDVNCSSAAAALGSVLLAFARVVVRRVSPELLGWQGVGQQSSRSLLGLRGRVGPAAEGWAGEQRG